MSNGLSETEFSRSISRQVVLQLHAVFVFLEIVDTVMKPLIFKIKV